jgi:hypothetical protein
MEKLKRYDFVPLHRKGAKNLRRDGQSSQIEKAELSFSAISEEAVNVHGKPGWHPTN